MARVHARHGVHRRPYRTVGTPSAPDHGILSDVRARETQSAVYKKAGAGDIMMPWGKFGGITNEKAQQRAITHNV